MEDKGFAPAESFGIIYIRITIDHTLGISLDPLGVRHAIESELDNILGWTGNGECTGGDIGAEEMCIYCEAVDFEYAKRVIEDVLGSHELDGRKLDYRIEVEDFDPSASEEEG